MSEPKPDRAHREIQRYGRILSAFERGWIAGLTAYAWWRDGTEYVGTCGTTKNQAIADFIREGRHRDEPLT